MGKVHSLELCAALNEKEVQRVMSENRPDSATDSASEDAVKLHRSLFRFPVGLGLDGRKLRDLISNPSLIRISILTLLGAGGNSGRKI